MSRTSWKVAALLFCSGSSALIYQTAWFRQFRLVFGASTSATAAVLAIFMGGIGIGSALLGRRADAQARPLAFYGKLELLIAACAALSQPLLWLVARIYFGIGGSVTLGTAGATVVRLLLAAVVLGPATILMGGTLPAAARAVETDNDRGRRKLALLYAANTLGAVAGTLLGTFYLLERLGNRNTLLVAVVANAVIGLIAWNMGRSGNSAEAAEESAADAPSLAVPSALSSRYVVAASAIVGFAFLLMELVWYRMLAPLLGGTTFMFGLILATALAGIALGGAAYAFWSSGGGASAGAFALTCTLEAVALIYPFALGDRLAFVANSLRSLGRLGFGGHVFAWSIMTLIVVFPAAFIAGIQFPLLIALLGRGREEVGRHVGTAYAWNTAGAIAGSLAGGFGLLPLLTAPATWQLAGWLLIALGAVTAVLALRARERGLVAASLAAALAAVLLSTASGPTALWRHSGIGAGRAPQPQSANELRAWVYNTCRTLLWDADGRESSVALIDSDDIAFIVNGKADGSARGDAGTQVMSGLVGAIVQPNPRRALVIGLGTGSTAGWLAAIPSMERVDVVELEPVVLDVARQLAVVNHGVLANPKVHVRVADAREVLLAARDQYDVIFSEPSNPYRAGIASLFTREYYAAIRNRLAPGGVFIQWVQAYDVDAGTLATIYRTATSVFRNVDTWRAEPGDLLLVATREPIVFDYDALRARAAQSPFREALHAAWRNEGVEGLLSHFVANDVVARKIAAGTTEVNSDDRTVIEFGFARALGEAGAFDIDGLLLAAEKLHADHPTRTRGALDPRYVLLNRASEPSINVPPPRPFPEYDAHHDFHVACRNGLYVGAVQLWESHRLQPANSLEMLNLGEALAELGREEALGFAEALRRQNVVEAESIEARLRLKQKRYPEAADHFERALLAYRTDPWPYSSFMGRTLDAVVALARQDRRQAPRMFNALGEPFAAGQWNDARKIYRVAIAAEASGCSGITVGALQAMEPWPRWTEDSLRIRSRCYAEAGRGDLAATAQREYAEFLAAKAKPLLQ
jgi:spermidine synthase